MKTSFKTAQILEKFLAYLSRLLQWLFASQDFKNKLELLWNVLDYVLGKMLTIGSTSELKSLKDTIKTYFC